MSMSQKNLALARAIFQQVVRNSSSSSSLPVTPRYHKLKQIQKHFGIEDGTLVHLKRGMFDKFLFQFTFLTTLVGLGMSGEVFYVLTFGKSE